jgi:hypothetical protein
MGATMIEYALVRVAIVIGTAWWLTRVVFSRSERRKLDRAMKALEEC